MDTTSPQAPPLYTEQLDGGEEAQSGLHKNADNREAVERLRRFFAFCLQIDYQLTANANDLLARDD